MRMPASRPWGDAQVATHCCTAKWSDRQSFCFAFDETWGRTVGMGAFECWRAGCVEGEESGPKRVFWTRPSNGRVPESLVEHGLGAGIVSSPGCGRGRRTEERAAAKNAFYCRHEIARGLRFEHVTLSARLTDLAGKVLRVMHREY